MFLNKPTSGLTYEDIEALTSSGEPESIMLDYKVMISGSERDKAELAKDICAFANSQGGYLIIGVEEKGGRPIHPPCGTERMLGRQNAEEWVAQVLNTNIAQRVHIDIKVISIPQSDKCIIVLHVPVSVRMPHMVTFSRDNRYYRRIFKRHQFESLAAEEYEVREMFERGSRISDKVIAYLSSQGYHDPSSNEFADNTYTKRLGMAITGAEGQELVQASHYVTFITCPDLLADDLLDTSAEELWSWLEPNSRRYQPDPDAIFMPLNKRMTLDGIILTDQEYYHRGAKSKFIPRFLRINRNGYIELGCTLARKEGNDVAFAYMPMIGHFWQFISFVVELYRRAAVYTPFKVMLNMKGTEGALLYSLGVGWIEPFDKVREYRPRCPEANIQVIKVLISADLSDNLIAELVKEVAERVDNAWGQREPRCYNHAERDPEKRLPINRMRGFFS